MSKKSILLGILSGVFAVGMVISAIILFVLYSEKKEETSDLNAEGESLQKDLDEVNEELAEVEEEVDYLEDRIEHTKNVRQ